MPGKSHGRRSLVGCSPRGRQESDTTERLPFHFSLSHIGEGDGNPLQCSCLENPRDGEAWWAAVYGVAQSWTQLKRLSSSSSRTSLVIQWLRLQAFNARDKGSIPGLRTLRSHFVARHCPHSSPPPQNRSFLDVSLSLTPQAHSHLHSITKPCPIYLESLTTPTTVILLQATGIS